MNVHAKIPLGQPLVIMARSNLYEKITLISRFKIETIGNIKNFHSEVTLIFTFCIPSATREFLVARLI